MLYFSIVNYHSHIEVRRLLLNISKLTTDHVTIIITDNSESETEYEKLLSCSNELGQLKQITVILLKAERNGGYGAGHNNNFRYIEDQFQSGYIFVVNNDIHILPNTIQRMIEYLDKNPKSQLMCPTYYYETENVMYTYIIKRGLSQYWCKEKFLGDHESQYCAGSFFSFLFNRSVGIQKFNEDYFLYWEEVEYSDRLKRMGYIIKSIDCDGILRAENSIATNLNSDYYIVRNAFLYWRSILHRRHVSSLIIFLTRKFLQATFLTVKHAEKAYFYNFLAALRSGLLQEVGKRPDC